MVITHNLFLIIPRREVLLERTIEDLIFRRDTHDLILKTLAEGTVEDTMFPEGTQVHTVQVPRSHQCPGREKGMVEDLVGAIQVPRSYQNTGQEEGAVEDLVRTIEVLRCHLIAVRRFRSVNNRALSTQVLGMANIHIGRTICLLHCFALNRIKKSKI